MEPHECQFIKWGPIDNNSFYIDFLGLNMNVAENLQYKTDGPFLSIQQSMKLISFEQPKCLLH